MMTAGADRHEERIESVANSAVKLAKTLHRRKGRDASGLILLEGRRLVADALRSGCVFEFAMVADGVDFDLPADPEQCKRVLRCPAKVLAAAAETTHPQGVLAVARTPRLAPPISPTFVLALDAVSDPGNVGALVRTAAAAAVDAIVLVGAQSADAWSPKALRAAMGATMRVPILECPGGWPEADELLRGRWKLRVRCADAAPGSAPHDAVDWTASALVVGAEVGLSPELIDACDAADAAADATLSRVHIPIANVESLNAAVAGSVILLDARRQLRLADPGASLPA